MALNFQYNKIIKYKITAECKQPLHIGSALNEKEEVLVHPVDNMPFIQAASIIGVFRSYCTKSYGEKKADEMFGYKNLIEKSNASEYGSKIKVTDGVFDKSTLKLELRPRVSINAETGSVSNKKVNGTNRLSGQKFNTEYIGAGAEFNFSIYLYEEKLQSELETVLSALNEESIQFGGQKSNGCGYIELKSVLYKEFDIKNADDRNLWFKEEYLEKSAYEEKISKLPSLEKTSLAYEITVNGKTEGEILVKDINIGTSSEVPDSSNMKNANGNYIVPGSSFKGVIRSQIERIAKYLKDDKAVEEIFGSNEEKSIGNVSFMDTVLYEEYPVISHRIHIDKFTGGVMQGSLFTEENMSGKMIFKINIYDRENSEKSVGFLIMALRDLANGIISVGSGYSVGKGIIDVSSITVKDKKNGSTAIINFNGEKSSIDDKDEIISRCLKVVIGGK